IELTDIRIVKYFYWMFRFEHPYTKDGILIDYYYLAGGLGRLVIALFNLYSF
ncbi:2505_t:CDS:1, partial [Dentiscutata erythropus]